MKKWSIILMILLFLSLTTTLEVNAHSGRTDSSGGHNCSEKSIAKGLCTGYHYHNGGSSDSPQTSTPSATPEPEEPAYDPKIYYDRGYDSGYSKGFEAGYKKGKQDAESTDSNEDYVKGWDAGFEAGYAEGLEKIEAEEKIAKDKATGAEKGKVDGRAAFLAGRAIDAFDYETQESEAYVNAYHETFADSWETAKLEDTCFNEGYNQGLIQDELVISKACEKDSLRTAFEKGHKVGVDERDHNEIEKLTRLGETEGYAVAELIVPKEAIKPSYQSAFEKGYEAGKMKRKEEIHQEGYYSAFEQIDFKEETYTDHQELSEWFKEGYESNDIAKEIKSNAQTLGEESDEYVIAEKFKVNAASISLYDSLFEQGQNIKEQREEEQRNIILLAGAAIVAPTAGGFYFWRRKHKKAI